ncbi:MAG: hypothetical protein AB1635_09085 [Acidobacteriota bacterium]
MADDVMAVAERLARLETTVATGFFELRGEIGAVDGRLRGDIGGVEGRLRGEIGAVEGRLLGEIGAVEIRLRSEIAGCEGRLRALIDAGRDESRAAFEGVGVALQRIEARLDEMHREHVQDRADRSLRH